MDSSDALARNVVSATGISPAFNAYASGTASPGSSNMTTGTRPMRAISIIIYMHFTSRMCLASPIFKHTFWPRKEPLHARLSPHPPAAGAVHEGLGFRDGHTVKIPADGVLQARCGNGELKRVPLAFQSVQTIDRTRREAVAAAHAVNDGLDSVLAVEEKFASIQRQTLQSLRLEDFDSCRVMSTF